jgi:hypothetical protein
MRASLVAKKKNRLHPQKRRKDRSRMLMEHQIMKKKMSKDHSQMLLSSELKFLEVHLVGKCCKLLLINYLSFFKNEDQDIILGRASSADIQIDDKLLSKIQFVIRFSEG